MSSAVIAKGTQLQREDTPGSGTFTTVAEVRSIEGPGNDADEIEVSNMDSGDYKEFKRGLIDAGQIQFAANWFFHATHSQILTDQAAGTVSTWRIRWASMSPVKTATFSAFVKTASFSNNPNDVVQANVTLRVSGAVTYA